MERVNPEYDDPRNDMGADDDSLRPMESLDPDDVRNDDGDAVVDPPERWASADKIAEEPEGESLDEKLAAEEPEPAAPAEDVDTGGDTQLRPDDEVNHIDPENRGTDQGQVSGSPENGDSMFPVVE